jgi:uncharacterized repeat protein (TIGR03987 family)
MTTASSVIITLALLFYSIGVWSERIQGRLKAWHLAFFWLGLVCDTWGTGLIAVWVVWLIPYFSPMVFALG